MENLSSIFSQLSPGPDGWIISSVTGKRKYGRKKKEKKIKWGKFYSKSYSI